MKTRIHVNSHNLKRNKLFKNTNRPVFTVKTYKSNHTGNKVEVGGPSMLVYKPEAPMKGGAVAWIETDSPVWVYK